MAELPRPPLDYSQEEIRLLWLDTQDHPDRRRHRLISNVPFKLGRVKYSALSYTWGDTKDTTDLVVDKYQIKITSNLAKALDDAVAFWRRKDAGRNAEVYLWIDQICINHRDNEEKSQQVKLASEIYRQADQVLIWIPLSKPLQGTFETWERWADWHRRQVDPKAMDQPSQNELMMYSNASKSSASFPILNNDDRRDRDLMVAWEHVHAITTSVWWMRVWTYEEFLCAKEAVFLIQELSVSWKHLLDFLAIYFYQRRPHSEFWNERVNTLRQRQQKLDSAPPEESGCCGCGIGSGNTARNEQNVSKIAEQNALQQQITHLENYILEWTAADESWHLVNNILNTKEAQTKPDAPEYTKLSTLLEHGRKTECSDPRDKVYAFLGLADPSYKIKPDYSHNSNTVFIETAQALIKKEERLDILAIARLNGKIPPGGQSLPSWVPDWSDKSTWNSEYKQFLHDIRFPADSKASGDIKAVARFQAQFLLTRGILADRLSKMEEDHPYRPFRRFSTENGRTVSTVKQAKAGDEVWVLMGANEPFVTRKGGTYYFVLGHAMIMEAGAPSPILKGALIDQLLRGDATAQDLQIA